MFKYEIKNEQNGFVVCVSDNTKVVYQSSLIKDYDDAMYVMREKHKAYAMALFKACVNNAKANR